PSRAKKFCGSLKPFLCCQKREKIAGNHRTADTRQNVERDGQCGTWRTGSCLCVCASGTSAVRSRRLLISASLPGTESDRETEILFGCRLYEFPAILARKVR